MSGFCAVSDVGLWRAQGTAHCVAYVWMSFTHLGVLLVHTSLGLGERGRSGLLGTGFGRLSLRRTVSAVQSLKSTQEQRHCCHLLGSSQVTPALQRVQAADIWGHHCRMVARKQMRRAEAGSSRVQVMLTMVSIDATDGLNEELSRSLSLQRKFLKRKRQRKVGVRENAGASAAGSVGRQVFEERATLCT